MLNWEKSVIKEINHVSNQTAIFMVEVLNANALDFIPGQFITFDLPIHEKRNKRLRSYSIASPPNQSNVLELIIGKVPDGAASKFFFDKDLCDVGTELSFRGPLGVFTTPKDLTKHQIFVCTGTGVAPFKSMIEHLIQNETPFNSIDLVFGARTVNDILYKEELDKLDAEIDNFNYHVCLSREEYKGYKGYVHEIYQKIAAQQKQEDTEFMFCGWREMIDQAREELSKLNYTKQQINFELYG